MCGGGTGGETTRPILLKPSSVCAHLELCVTFSWDPIVRTCLCWRTWRWTEGLWKWYDVKTWCWWLSTLHFSTCRCTRQPCLGAFFKTFSSPGSLSSSHDKSSELTSARLGVGLKSSESESASSILTPLLWLWGSGSGDAPESNRKTWLNSPIMLCMSVWEPE